jgi:hypothetical protein
MEEEAAKDGFRIRVQSTGSGLWDQTVEYKPCFES